jgi:hypothetical protein
VVLKTVGPAGQTFHAVLNIDGNRQELSGTSPAAFPLEVCWMTAEVQKIGGTGVAFVPGRGAAPSSRLLRARESRNLLLVCLPRRGDQKSAVIGGRR